jgi:DNA polymerase-3 subunit beta
MIELDRRQFTQAIKIAHGVTEKRKTIPLLSTVKAIANGRLELEATDLDLTARVALPCKADANSEFLISDVDGLVSAIGAAGGSLVELMPQTKSETTKAGFIAAAGQLRRVVAHGMAAEDFPSNQSAIGEQHFEAKLSVEAVAQIERIAAAISTEETRYYLNGIRMQHLTGWTYRFAATDGHRLMIADVDLPEAEGTLDRDLILPRKFLRTVFKHYKQASGPISLSAGFYRKLNKDEDLAPGPSGWRVSLGLELGDLNVRFDSKVIDGTYPDVSRVIPTAHGSSALFKVAELRRAILAVMGKPSKSHSPALSLEFDGGGVVVGYAFGVEGITANYKVHCQHNVPVGFKIGLKATYALDILAAVHGEEVTFFFREHEASSSWGDNAAAEPVLIRDTSDATFFAVQMPMRI